MNKYYAFIFFVGMTQFVGAMDTSDNIKMDALLKKMQKDFVLDYPKGLVHHFYSFIPTDVTFVHDNNSQNLYECAELRKNLGWTINDHTLSFFNRENGKAVDCHLEYKGEKLNDEKSMMLLLVNDRAKVQKAYYTIAFN